MFTRIFLTIIAALTLVTFSAAAQGKPGLWEDAIRAFETQDAKTPPPAAPILFVGSSTVRLWPVERSFAGLPVLNRGFGGSHMADVNFYADRIVFPYKPKTIVLYSGDNDVAADLSADAVFAEFKKFFDRVEKELPETRLIVLGVKSSPARWAKDRIIRQLNTMLESACKDKPNRTYVDTYSPVLGEDGTPRTDYFAGDGLHLNAAGYEVWTRLLKPLLS